MNFAAGVFCFPALSVTSTFPLCLASGTKATTRLGPRATIGAWVLLNQALQSAGSEVSYPVHEIITSPPAMPAAGSIFVISALELIQLQSDEIPGAESRS